SSAISINQPITPSIENSTNHPSTDQLISARDIPSTDRPIATPYTKRSQEINQHHDKQRRTSRCNCPSGSMGAESRCNKSWPHSGMITPAVPSLAPITTSFTPLAPINPVALASSDTITSQSGQIDLPPAVAPSDSFTDHESELDQSPSDSISAMFNDNEEKDTTPLNEVAEHTPKKDSSIQPAQDLVAITVTQDVVTNFEEYNFTI
ncbi:hypothetical protein MJO29_013183, partial [Puccinia striiformis f. sp. tritici]